MPRVRPRVDPSGRWTARVARKPEMKKNSGMRRGAKAELTSHHSAAAPSFTSFSYMRERCRRTTRTMQAPLPASIHS
jgi:hypothetical protein